MIVDNAIYVDGRRTEEPRPLQETYEAVRQRRGMAWIGLYKPTEEEFGSVAREFGLHPLAVEDPLKAPLRTVQDHALRITERVEGFREMLQNILSVNLTLVGLSQNEEVKTLTEASIAQNDQVKKISAWAAILFAPTLIGTVYGMNFDYVPELHWRYGYPFALVLMVMVSVTLYLVFKRRGWL
jgi:magnesium transporter